MGRYVTSDKNSGLLVGWVVSESKPRKRSWCVDESKTKGTGAGINSGSSNTQLKISLGTIFSVFLAEMYLSTVNNMTKVNILKSQYAKRVRCSLFYKPKSDIKTGMGMLRRTQFLLRSLQNNYDASAWTIWRRR